MAKAKSMTPHHCGIYYGGKVLHAMQDGTVYQDMASLQDQFELIEFWAKQ